MVEHLTELIPMQCGVLYLYDRSSDELWAAAAVGVSMSSFRIPAGRGFVGHCHQTRQTVVVRNAAENEHYDSDIESHLGLKLLSVLCAPIINSAGQCVGVVQGINKDLGFFNNVMCSCWKCSAIRPQPV